MINFGLKLRKLRQDKGITQDELANVLDMARSTISHYESSALFPSIEVMVLLADYFNVSIDYLTDRTNIKYENNIWKNLTDEQAALLEGIAQQMLELNALKNK